MFVCHRLLQLVEQSRKNTDCFPFLTFASLVVGMIKYDFRYFLAEGVVCQHGVYLVSTNERQKSMLSNLPKPISSRSSKSEKSSNCEDMKIAFMYKSLPQNAASLSDTSRYGHYYDLSSTMETDLVGNCDTMVLNVGEIYSEHKCIFT